MDDTAEIDVAESIIQELSSVSLPVFDYSLQVIQQVNEETNNPWNEFSRIILKDPAFTLHILRKVRGSSRNSLRSDAVGIPQATMMLGLNQMQTFPRDLPRLSKSLQGEAQAGYLCVAARSFHAAYQARDWAIHLLDLFPEEIYIAALLHDVADMVFWICASDKMQRLEKLTTDEGLATDEAQYLVFGESLEHYSRLLADAWDLPYLVHECLRPENTARTRIHGVMLAIQLAHEVENGWYQDKVREIIEMIAEYLNMPVDKTTARIHQTAVAAARETLFYNTRPAAALLPMLPLKKKKSDRNVQKDGQDTVVAEKQANDSTATQVCLVPQQNVYEDIVNELQENIANFSLNDLMRKIIHGMHDGAGLNRVVFTMLSPDRSTLQTRFMIGTDNDAVFNNFQIEVNKKNLFSLLLRKQQSVWVNDSNRDKYWPLVPKDIKDLIKTDSFYVMSVHVNDKPVGMFYADRNGADCQLNEQIYTRFCDLCKLAAQGIAHRSKVKN